MKVRDTLKRIQEEPHAVGEPAESIQIGRLQVVDEVLLLFDNEDSEIVEVDRERLKELLVSLFGVENQYRKIYAYMREKPFKREFPLTSVEEAMTYLIIEQPERREEEENEC